MRFVRSLAAVAGALALSVAGVPTAHADPVPPYFGSDHADPRTADQPVARPDTASCTTRIVDHGFRDYNVYRSAFAPPASCRGDWS